MCALGVDTCITAGAIGGKGLKEALKGFVVVAGSSITTTMAGMPILTLAMRFSELLTENWLLWVLCSSRLCKLPWRRRLFRSFMLEERARFIKPGGEKMVDVDCSCRCTSIEVTVPMAYSPPFGYLIGRSLFLMDPCQSLAVLSRVPRLSLSHSTHCHACSGGPRSWWVLSQSAGSGAALTSSASSSSASSGSYGMETEQILHLSPQLHREGTGTYYKSNKQEHGLYIEVSLQLYVCNGHSHSARAFVWSFQPPSSSNILEHLLVGAARIGLVSQSHDLP